MTSSQASSLLTGLATIILVAGLLGQLARRFGQPAVIGEILAGIALGPTLFGGAVSDALLPTDIRPFLTALANVGVAVFMFLVGLEIDRDLIRGTGRITASVSLSAILLPCGLGIALGYYLLRDHPSDNRPGFVLFMGVAMSITAFPVLARILTDRDLHRTPLGALALCCAAVGDVLAWSLLAVVVAIVSPEGHLWRTLLFVPYLLLMVFPVRRLLARPMRRLSQSAVPGTLPLAVMFAGLLLSGAATEWMGLHFIFGAFLFGAVIPRSGSAPLRAVVHERIGMVNNVLLLPVFFLVAGLQVDLSHIGPSDLLDLALILLAAVGGKFVGAYTAARANKLGGRISAALALLMNTRGLTELIVLNVGLQLHILDTRVYSLMVVMAVVTTAITSPLLEGVYPRRLAVKATAGDLAPGRRAVPAAEEIGKP
ncbi:cation:proton antiporter [Actinacidiphila sp. ITFR-21]|uniref:cation:proton antiporter domain-containing protein n=1 Tax=Actinacidiphila sp. ITFR-21 TaxID=3075199 RepID=UPI00288910CB|nr:cation:proton antiporter [Streptomyces sp. ITFR-21]WNI14484.1 cation:proton antiporter [Streptomyces sp. ITFR-21]